jgi:hypothetical protein
LCAHVLLTEVVDKAAYRPRPEWELAAFGRKARQIRESST